MLGAHYNIILDSSWSEKSLVLNVLPVVSLLVLLGIMEAQILFIRHVASALYNRDRWRSIYMRDSEKSKGFPTGREKHSLRPWNYWVSLVVLGIYGLVVLCCIILQAILKGETIGMPICISILFFLSTINSFVVWRSSNFGDIRQNKDDLLFLRVVPLLFSASMMGMCLLAWLYYAANGTYSISVWILLESLMVYLPLLSLLVMCIHARKFKTMGRQYPHQHSQRLSQDISFITKRLTEEEVKSKCSQPLSTYCPY